MPYPAAFGYDVVGAVREEEERKRREQEAAQQAASTLEGGAGLRGQAQAGLAGVQGREAPQAAGTTVGQVAQFGGAQIAQGPQEQWRQRQIELANRLSGIAGGTQQGAGELAAQRAASRALASQQAMARMGRGSGAAMAARGAARNVADIGGVSAGQQSEAALRDQAAATAQLGGLLGQGRGADIGLATGQAGLAQQAGLANMSAENQRIFQQAGLDQATSLANMQSKLATMGMNDQAALAYMAQLYNISMAEMQARLQLELGEMGQPKDQSIWPGVISAAGTIGAAAAMSDKRVKKDITEPGDMKIDDLMGKLKAYSYRYKDEKHGKGKFLGVMAQDLERSELGSKMVKETPDGKAVDYGKGFGTLLAATVRLSARLKAMEEGK